MNAPASSENMRLTLPAVGRAIKLDLRRASKPPALPVTHHQVHLAGGSCGHGGFGVCTWVRCHAGSRARSGRRGSGRCPAHELRMTGTLVHANTSWTPDFVGLQDPHARLPGKALITSSVETTSANSPSRFAAVTRMSSSAGTVSPNHVSRSNVCVASKVPGHAGCVSQYWFAVIPQIVTASMPSPRHQVPNSARRGTRNPPTS